MTYVITQGCIDLKDKTCIDVCPVDCIYEGDRMMYINPVECVDCGACEPVCPVEAIYFDRRLPDEFADFKSAQADFFEQLGNPGGGSRVGPQPYDSIPASALG